MSLVARLETVNWVTTYPDTNGGEIDQADILISIYDAVTGLPANGNNCIVTYQVNTDGFISNETVAVPGQSVKIYSGVLNESHYSPSGDVISATFTFFSVVSLQSGQETPPQPPAVCDLQINFITVDKPESAPGAADAQITVNASSTFGPILYSINSGETWQTSPTFTGLNGGLVSPFAKDSNPLGCRVQGFVDVPINTNLLVSDPSVTISPGKVSRWNAAFNPIVFTYQRTDFGVIDVHADAGTGNARVLVNTALINYLTAKYSVNLQDKVYINAGPYKGVYNIIAFDSFNQIVLDTPFAGSAHGYININSMRPYYKIITRITYQDKLTGQQKTIQSINRPNNEGVTRTDLSHFLQSILLPADSNDYNLSSLTDNNLSASYQVAFAESYDDGTPQGFIADFITLPYSYYVVYAAKQLGERYGGNLAAYVPFKQIADSSKLARWVTDFAEPAYSAGYPFDIGFIYAEDLLGLSLYAEIILLDINRNPLDGGLEPAYLLNEDGSWLMSEDGSSFVIADQVEVNTPVVAQPGLNRFRISGDFPADAYYINLTLKYNDDKELARAVTQTQTIRIDNAVDDNSVYLRWIGLSGSWEYYRFVFNQEVSLDVQNAVIIKNFVSDWENQDGIEQVISKTAGQKMKVMAEDLSVNDIKGLQSIKYSPKVQLLVNRNPAKWQTIVINTATYAEYETRNGQAPFSLTFNMPSINIQTQ